MSTAVAPEKTKSRGAAAARKRDRETAEREREAAGRTQRLRRTATALKMAADGTRLGILALLAERERNVTEICSELNMSQPAVSHHLSLLRHSRLVEPVRIGKNNIYNNTPEGQRLANTVRGFIEG